MIKGWKPVPPLDTRDSRHGADLLVRLPLSGRLHRSEQKLWLVPVSCLWASIDWSPPTERRVKAVGPVTQSHGARLPAGCDERLLFQEGV
jgi:hypothetical protein